MAAVTIGRCTCPVCKNTRASLRVSEKQLAYVVCNACNVQVFARSDQSDEKLRALHIPDEPAAPAVEPVAAPAPVAPEEAPKPEHIEPTPAPARRGWGMLG